MCLARYFMNIYDVIVLDIESSECDSEVKGLDTPENRRVFCMLFFVVLPFVTLAVSMSG